jgi:serine-type D-Ala-D-Ala carboxypeptidase (penicillin-binding protein 5/6)
MTSVLQGGAKRRRGPRRLVVALLVALALAGGGVAAVTYVTGGDDGTVSGKDDRAASVRPSAPAKEPERKSGRLPRRLPPGITIVGPNAVDVRLEPRPAAALMFDVDTGRVMWRLKPMRVRPIASVTKIMTALLAVQRLPRDATSLIRKEAVRYTGSMVGVLPRGKRVSVRTLLYGAMLPSGNDAAVALADRMAGSDRRFARLMNRKARRLKLSCTRFVSSYGLQKGNVSCPADLAALTRVVMQQPRIAEVVGRRSASPPFPFIQGKHLTLYNTNPLLRMGYKGTIGLKTGTTDEAGHCFVAVVRRGGHTLGVVLLNSPDIGGQAVKLLDAGFRSLRRGGARSRN